MHLTAAQPDRRGKAQKRLATLAALRDTAPARLEHSAGFLASLDPDAIEAYLASDSPEIIGAGPRRKRA